MILRLRAWALWLPILILSGCATVPEPQALRPGEIERSGRFALLVQDPQTSDQSLQGRFFWQDTQQGLTLDLSSSLGITLARIEVQPHQSVLIVPGEEPVVADTADDLLIKVFAEPIPIHALRDWMQGRLSTTLRTSEVKRDTDLRLTSFKAGDWQIDLSRYDEQGPTFLSLSQQAGARVVSLKLIVDAQP